VVAHPRSATANAPGARNPQRRPSDPTHHHDPTRPAATPTALGAASHVRPEPLKPRLQTPSRRPRCASVVCRRTLNQYQTALRAGPPLHVSALLCGPLRLETGDTLRGPSSGNRPDESYGTSHPGLPIQVVRRGPTRGMVLERNSSDNQTWTGDARVRVGDGAWPPPSSVGGMPAVAGTAPARRIAVASM